MNIINITLLIVFISICFFHCDYSNDEDPCFCNYLSFINLDNPQAELPNQIACSEVTDEGFSVTAVKTNAIWFEKNGNQYFGTQGLPFDHSSIRTTATFNISDKMLFQAGDTVKLFSRSASNTCYSKGTLIFFNDKGETLSSVNLPCNTTHEQEFTIPLGCRKITLRSGDWGTSLLIKKITEGL